MSTYEDRNILEYTTLDTCRKEVRLLAVVLPMHNNAPLRFNLRVVSLLDSPRYTALSYVWGDESSRQQITVDGAIATIPVNLARALEFVGRHWSQCYPDRSISELQIWADALCINQQNLVEKNEQVSLMSAIFKGSELTLAWLTSSNDDVRLALQTFRIIARETQTKDDNDVKTHWMAKYPFLCSQDSSEEEASIGNQAWNAVWRFSRLEYWKRAWIFQEIVLSNSIIFCCDDVSLTFHDLVMAHLWGLKLNALAGGRMHNPESPLRPVAMTTVAWRAVAGGYVSWDLLRTIQRAKSALKVSERRWSFLMEGANLHATDPRDHIYGLLGIIEDGLEAEVSPSYEKTVAEVYSEVFSMVVDEEQHLAFLCHAGIGRFKNEWNLPSWAPNLPEASKMPDARYIARGNAVRGMFQDHNDRIIVSNTTLCSFGTKIDDVARVTPLTTNSWNDGTMLDFCIRLVNRKPRNNDRIPPLQAIFNIIMGRFDDSTREESTESEAQKPEAAGSSSKYFHLLALGFLSNVIRTDPRQRLDQATLESRFLALGLSIGDNFPESFETSVFSDCDFRNSGLPNIATDFYVETGPIPEAAWAFIVLAIHYLNDFCWIETNHGYLGLAPIGTKPGDSICILKRCMVPVVLRKYGECHALVGTSFVSGLMEGEAAELLRGGEAQIEEIRIK